MAETHKEAKNESNENKQEQEHNDPNGNHTQDVQMNDKSKLKPTDTSTTKKDKKESRKDSKRRKKRDGSSSRHRSRDTDTSYHRSRHHHRDRYRHKSRSHSKSRSRSRSHSRHRSRHRRRSRSHSPYRDRDNRRHRSSNKEYRRSSRHRDHSYPDRRGKSAGSRPSHSHSQSHSHSSSGSPKHHTHGPTMAINVTVYPKSTPGESKVITFDIARTSTVSDFKGTLCARGFNVFLQYNLLVAAKELDVEDDRLLCVHVGIKPNGNDKHIMVQPKTGSDAEIAADEYDPFLASSGKNKSANMSGEELQKAAKKKETERADQIEMYKAYEEMFGVEEAAGMMGFDPAEVKRVGIEAIFERLLEEERRKKLDREAAEAARSGGGGDAYDYSQEMQYAQQAQAQSLSTGTEYNDNLVDHDTAVGTTHTAGGGTVSRPPPSHVSENACIFVGDLHPSVTRSDLLSVFSQIGSVCWMQLFDCHAQMNRPFNFAFVYFEDLLCARNAIQTLNYTKFYGSPCRLMWKQEKNTVQWTDCNIIVKNLPPNTDSRILHSVFSKFGKILSSKVKTTATGRTLPYGYVQYGAKHGADAAIMASDRGELSVSGHMLTAEWFKSREDRAFRQIYVKNIPSNWSDTDLLNLFEAQTLGKIKSFTVKHSPYGRWACISFHEPHHAVKAIEKLNNCPTGDPISPTLSVSRFMYKTERDKFKTNELENNNVGGHGSQAAHCHVAPEQCYSIYVGNVPLQLTDQHMRQLFEPFGAVISAAVVQKTQDYKYGFVNFQQPQDAARALVTMNGKSIGGKTLQVKPANTDMSKAIAITQAATHSHSQSQSQTQLVNVQSHHNQNQHRSRSGSGNGMENVLVAANPVAGNKASPNMTHQQAKDILNVDGKKEILWKVQYGEDWHEYDTTLAAIVEQLAIGEQIQITLADSNYIITRIQQQQAMQKNCASGTMRKVVRSTRDLQ